MSDSAHVAPSGTGESTDVLHAPLVIEFPFSRTTGPVIGAFFTGLRNKKVIGIRAEDGRVICPPVEYDPISAASLTELVPVAETGSIVSWTWVEQPAPRQPLDRPFAWAMVQLDGADTTLLNALDASSADAVSTGARVQIRWRDERVGELADIECFELITEAGGN